MNMKRNISKLLIGVCLSSSMLINTGCIEETFPTNAATEDQVTSSEEAAGAMLWSMHAMLNTYAIDVDRSRHFDWGYGSIMHIRDVQTGDMPISSSGYDHYWPWEENIYQGESYIYNQFVWNFYWRNVLAANKLLAAFPLETSSNVEKGYVGAAHAFRALMYLDMARMYEYLPTDGTSMPNDAGNDVTNLTVPIVTEKTTEEESYNNPRVTREKMAEFILSDLQAAEENIVYLTESSRALPHLDAVYGLMARYYMWLEDYPNAKTYARKAIDESKLKPMTQEDCLSTSKGFNTLSCWIWGSQLVKENDVVQTGIVNWTSWMSNETSFGYAAQRVGGPYTMIDANMYSRINDNDFRKRMWKAPQGTALDGKTNFLTSANPKYGNFGTWLPSYASVKFRPGEGNPDDVNLAAAIAYPLMRVEEMYFIEAEAAEHVAAGTGKVLLENFMNTYRLANDAPEGTKYVCSVTDVVDEIIFQKRVELWGERQTFFDIKRLDMPIDRTYKGSNFYSNTQFKTTRRPAWMNFCIVQTEKNSNAALRGYENPDPSQVY